MLTLAQVLDAHSALGEDDRAWLSLLVDRWSLLADLSFADLILWVPDEDDNVFWAGAQVRPMTGPTSLSEDVVGEDIAYDPEHLVTEAYLSQEIAQASLHGMDAGIPVDIQAIPILADDRCIGVVEIHTNRMGTRAPGALEETYLEVAELLAGMVMRRQFPIPGDDPLPQLSPSVGDGTIRVGPDGIVKFASPNAVSAFRRLGLTGDLEGERLARIVDSFDEVSRAPVERSATKAFGQRVGEFDLETSTATVRLRTLPLTDASGSVGALVMCRDTTDLRSQERQLVTKDATIREIHHRVKNNLQTVAALLRLQARRIESPEARAALQDAMTRVAAIAVVHEILSQAFDTPVKFDDVADRLLAMVGDVSATGGKVRMVRDGSFGYVPADVATNLSLVLTELCQNAVEHGFKFGPGEVVIRPSQTDGVLSVAVRNEGEPLPEGFMVDGSASLGLSIVSTLVDDLNGVFTLTSDTDGGTIATVTVPLV